ncbi:MAG TPA: SGNH/GDSL hydrolase family protein [Microlunatus sp.]|nr:SGNH/GDSL hydrolase family protein [Microlunatus sp.]
MPTWLKILARALAALGLAGVAVAVGAFLLTGAAPRAFVALLPPPEASVVPSFIPSPTAPPTPALTRVHVVAIGDSVTAGNACNCTAFPALYADGLERDHDVRTYVRNDGAGGETSADVLDDLRGDQSERDDLARADIVLVTIGANDFGPQYDQITSGTCGGRDHLECVRPTLGALPGRLTTIVQRIRELRRGAPTAILLTGYWNVFEDGQVVEQSMSRQGRADSDALTRATNQVVAQVAKAQRATYVDLYSPFKGSEGGDDPTDLLADDGDHPNAAGHRAIARALLAAGTVPVTLA